MIEDMICANYAIKAVLALEEKDFSGGIKMS